MNTEDSIYLRLATVFVNSRPTDDEKHRASWLNFNLKYCPEEASALLWNATNHGSSDDLSYDVKEDKSDASDHKICSDLPDPEQTAVIRKDDLYIADPKNAARDFNVTVSARVGLNSPCMANADWMQRKGVAFGRQKLRALCVPGSHDSGTYSISKHSPAGHDLDSEDLPGVGCDTVRAQGWSIEQQLWAGIRYLDIRLDNNAFGFTITHNWIGEQFSFILDDVKRFMDSYPREVVILDFQHSHGFSAHDYCELGRQLTDSLGAKIAPPTDITANSTVQDMWDGHYQAIVLVKKTSDTDDMFRLYPALWERQHNIDSDWADEDNEDELFKFLDEKVEEEHSDSKFWVLQGLRTPGNYTSSALGLSHDLHGMAVSTTPRVVKTMNNQWADDALNIVIVDFVDLAGFVQACIDRN